MLMPEEEVRGTFVARQGLLDELVSLISNQPDGAGVQHAVIIAPRGMGKTTVLLMVKYTIQDSQLKELSEIREQWEVVQFPEERYNIYDLSDFWLEILSHLDLVTRQDGLHDRIESLKREHPDNDELQEVALALIKDWRRKHNKRILLLVDNFDMILEQINDERDNARLRDVLMNDGTMMLIGGATTFFRQAWAYDQPLYNFFKIYELPNLKFEQMQELLLRRASADSKKDFEATLKANTSRLRVLEHFTGGNPRLLLMLYRVVTQSAVHEVRLGLEKLLDEVTPYYQGRVENLPAQQRKILDHIARTSSQTNEGLTPTEIALATRMSPNQASAQLKRLSENGYVQAVNVRGRNSYYTLSEQLYAIWHQMRSGRNARERMSWLVSILKVLYDAGEMVSQTSLLEVHYYKQLLASRLEEADHTSELWRYLLKAMEDLPEWPQPGQSSEGTAEGTDSPTARSPTVREISFPLRKEIKWKEARQQFDRALKMNANCAGLWAVQGFTLLQLKLNEEALECLDRALEIDPNLLSVWTLRGIVLYHLDRTREAIESFDKEPRANSGSSEVWSPHAVIYLSRFMRRLDEGRLDSAQKVWKELQSTAQKVNDYALHELLLAILLRQALKGEGKFVRQLIEDSNLAEPLFPLARALDYLKTRDETLLEKLSPEVRCVVEEIIAKLRAADRQVECR
jgi:tetratricopeptide (TPR) repeat protein